MIFFVHIEGGAAKCHRARRAPGVGFSPQTQRRWFKAVANLMPINLVVPRQLFGLDLIVAGFVAIAGWRS
jgi:hypothetical protein